MSDTPRTDELLLRGACYIDPNECDSVIDFARQLERELAEARQDAERYKTARCMTVRQWEDVALVSMRTGKPFDEIIDDLRPFMRADIDAARK